MAYYVGDDCLSERHNFILLCPRLLQKWLFQCGSTKIRVAYTN